MVVYDVIQTVKPGTDTSRPVGQLMVEHFDREEDAERYASRCNAVAWPGILFHVMAVDELSPARKPCGRDVREDGSIRNPMDYDGRKHISDWQ